MRTLSIAMQTSSVELFEHVVSQPRLNSYKRFFKAKTMDEAIGLYLWNGEISGCFASHLAYFEVILRNNSVTLTPREFRRAFTLVGRNNQPVRVRQARSSGLFIPD